MTTLLLFSTLLLPRADPHEEANPLYRELRQQGVLHGGKTVSRLPVPTLTDEQDAAGQKKVLETLPGRRVPVAEMLRQSINAPFVMTIGDIQSSEGLRLRTLDLWYVAYGSLDAISVNKEDAGLTPGQKAKSRVLTEAELAARKIQLDPTLKEQRLAQVHFSLLERVHVTAVLHTVASRRPQSVVLAGQIDSRFARDADFPNQWRPLDLTPEGRKLGPPGPYRINSSFVKVTRLYEPAGALFIEHHSVFEQPEGWFGGNDLLRSKLPIAMQNGVRNFREDLKKASR